MFPRVHFNNDQESSTIVLSVGGSQISGDTSEADINVSDLLHLNVFSKDHVPEPIRHRKDYTGRLGRYGRNRRGFSHENSKVGI